MATEAIPPKPKVDPREEERKKLEAQLPTSEEMKQRWAELRVKMGISKLAVTAPAGYTPYWARKNDTSELARLDYLGFRIVKDMPGQTPRYKAQGHRDDGTYVMGDVILMEIRSDDYQFFLAENARKGEQMSEQVKQQFIQDAESKGAPTFKVQRKG